MSEKTFEKLFPNLDNKTYMSWSEIDTDGNGGNLFLKQDIEKYCLDKQRVKEAIDKVFDMNDHVEKTNNKMIKKELGLE